MEDSVVKEIHEIREKNYLATKDFTIEERINYYKNRAEKFEKEMKSKKKAVVI